ncbi:unnamed protein product [Allacma fusca]|uniref:HMG box domain-containing protein n=1 Tax=Allacma fusca TaxID=39272 RepID=A0A8J2PK60_9HEXA|nr:unnamed protein product [Allacma fusca]
MDWERASPSEAVVAGDKKNKCNKPAANDLSNNNNPTTTGQLVSRKNKPIPPPLDLSIGAANLSLHHQNQSTTHPNLHPSSHTHHCSSNQIQPQSQPWDLHQQQSPLPSAYVGSPKFTQSEKSLPLRKRWHSWSTIQMNSQDESLLPLYSDGHLPSPLAVKSEGEQQGDSMSSESAQQNLVHQSYPYPMSATASSVLLGTNYRLPYGHLNGHGTGSSSNTLGLGLSIQTPSPFYTPNEPSPKFMNSPVFSYSTPDTSLYQGPFSPMRSSLYPPPSSPFTNLNLNTPGGPMSTGGMGSTCFNINMIPSTLLSPAPSQASTNSLSYEDLHEKSLNFFTPVWSIFMPGTRVRFCNNHHLNSMEWYPVDFLAQNDASLNFKGEYAPHGLEVRTLVVTSSSKERVQMTFCPVGDPDHPSIEVDCEPGHPFMVDKKVINVNLSVSTSPNLATANHQSTSANTPPHQLSSIKLESGTSLDEKMIPISVLPQTQMPHHHPSHHAQQIHGNSASKKFASHAVVGLSGSGSLPVPSSCIPSPAKRVKEGHQSQTPNEQKGRRPMNAFLLFAKDKRPELIQQFPGKDNRSISVLLGEAWANLERPEKERYSLNARARAEEQKRIHPDCWKRKRSQSTGNSRIS